jgi:hypothetical protein
VQPVRQAPVVPNAPSRRSPHGRGRPWPAHSTRSNQRELGPVAHAAAADLGDRPFSRTTGSVPSSIECQRASERKSTDSGFRPNSDVVSVACCTRPMREVSDRKSEIVVHCAGLPLHTSHRVSDLVVSDAEVGHVDSILPFVVQSANALHYARLASDGCTTVQVRVNTGTPPARERFASLRSCLSRIGRGLPTRCLADVLAARRPTTTFSW